jgi:hypothetical protein
VREPVIGATLTSWLLTQQRKGELDDELLILLTSIATACRRIASLVARAPLDGMVGLAASATANASGDAQKKLARAHARGATAHGPTPHAHTRSAAHAACARHMRTARRPAAPVHAALRAPQPARPPARPPS